ncbi:MAG: hypothetical protein E6G56_11530 [Actinobacteria bacterium]|nr:MAG: hypothetical protein E6G56_11530 [Actinomycetota bacterium]
MPRPLAPRRLMPAAGALIALGATLLCAGPAHASSAQTSALQDDQLLIYSGPEKMARTLDTLRGLGVQQIRVSVFWRGVAPQPLSKRRPAFDASDPAAYPPGTWDRYDLLVAAAHLRGMTVNFDITGPAPLWATGSPRRKDIANVYTPSAHEFRLFVHAVAARYTGSYPAAGSALARTSPRDCGLFGIGCPSPGPSPGPSPTPTGPTPTAPPASVIPKVDFWTVWNEPNQPGWLDPQWSPSRHGWVETAPALYRGLLDAAWSALQATGHGADTIAFGDTAPEGVHKKGPTRAIRFLVFLRRLYCLDDRYRPLTGQSARARRCPTTASARAAFPDAHPALFNASGYAHHPYQLYRSPDRPSPDRDYVTIVSLPRLSVALARATQAYGRGRGGMPLYLTEFGFQSRPPNPRGVGLSQQAAYLDEGEFLAYSNPWVRSLTQFLLQDDAARPGRNPARGSDATFQTGLQFLGGRPKPALVAYRLPLYLPRTSVRRGGALRVWGLARAAGGLRQTVAVQLRPAGGGARFSTLASFTTTASGYLDVGVPLRAGGYLRLSWRRPDGHPVISRLVAVHVR